MKTTKLHTLEEVLTNGITVDGSLEPIKVSCIFIPKIQRAYAQGRKGELDIRTDFLKDIFEALVSPQKDYLELSFLFGSKQPLINGTQNGFELLDGQQRTTTLFLINWYVHNREADEMPTYLSKFTYETRDTSSQFLKKISSAKFSFEHKKPSDVIKANKWFTDEFNCDATVCSMLNMLDDIHVRYESTGRKDLISSLVKLQFYVLLLEKFDMNDELYIKMNSRGLSLVPFENFKASIVKYMKGKERNGIYGTDDPEPGEIPYWLQFTSSIDARWIDIVWKKPDTVLPDVSVNNIIQIDDKAIGNSYFRFFNRYFFTKAAILKGVENRKMTDLPSFFYYETESEEFERRLKGWKNYEEILSLIEVSQPDEKYPVFGPLEKVLNAFHSSGKFILESVSNDPYGNTPEFNPLEKASFKILDRVLFAAVTEFIEAIPDGHGFQDNVIQLNYRRMLRVVHNIVENTPIENPVALVGVITAVKEIIHLPGAVDNNFYYSLCHNKVESRNRQLLEEVEKSSAMFNEDEGFIPKWEEAFKIAENHPFFKGSVNFFFTSGMDNHHDYSKRYELIKSYFDANGITKENRGQKQHILIRAILSCLNHWDASGMDDRYITENAEKEKYLKNIIVGNQDVRKLFCDYFDNKIEVSFDDYLKTVVENASCKEDENNQSFIMLYNRLITDTRSSAIFDWIEEREKSQKGRFRIQNNRSYIVAIPGKWYDQIVLDTERHKIIPSFIEQGFEYENKDQQRCIEGPMGDSWGWHIRITKVIGNYKIALTFNEWKWVDFFVFGDDPGFLMDKFSLTPDRIIDGGIKADATRYQFEKDKGEIEDKLGMIINTLNNIEKEPEEFTEII